MSDQTYAETPPADPPADNAAQQEAQKALEAEEIDLFLTQLEEDAEAMKREWMSARVPAYMRKAFEEKFPPPEPEPAPEPEPQA